MKINIVAVGRIKESYYKEALAEYDKRISRYASLTRTFLEEEKEGKDKLEREFDALSKFAEGYLIVADCGGEKLSSEQLAAKIKEGGAKESVTVIVGGSEGLSEKIKKQANLLWSLSFCTLPHALANVVITEQLYRALNINAKGKYHK
jgi:23S rRNA (pseudouridine1915-N3)-methyltransferase